MPEESEAGTQPEEQVEDRQAPDAAYSDVATEKFATSIRVKPGIASEELLALARANANDPSIFDERPPYFWSVEASSTREDSYSTLMHKSTLQNFANESRAGVSFQNSHRTEELGFGRTLDGRYRGPGGNGIATMEADLFTTPGINLNGISTDDLILGIRSGLIKDVSVGFHLGSDGFYHCRICKRQLFTEGCRHYPGVLYPEEEKEGAQLVKATAAIHNAHLSEISAVYDGATPSAGVLKARWAMDAGTLEPSVARQLEHQYRIKLPGSRHVWAGADAVAAKETPMAENPIPATEPPADVQLLQATCRSIEDALTDIGYPAADGRAPVPNLLRTIGAELIELRPLRDKVTTLETRAAELEPQAKDGAHWRETNVDAAVHEYIRVYGNDCDADGYRTRLMELPMPAVLKDREHYTERAKEQHQGGRVTDTGEAAPPSTPRPEVPLAAYLV